MPTVLVASEQAIEENWDAVYAWVKNYYEISEKYKDDIDTQSEYLLQMQLDNGIDTDEELARRFVDHFLLWKRMLNTSKAKLEIQKLMKLLIRSFSSLSIREPTQTMT